LSTAGELLILTMVYYNSLTFFGFYDHILPVEDNPVYELAELIDFNTAFKIDGMNAGKPFTAISTFSCCSFHFLSANTLAAQTLFCLIKQLSLQ